MNETIDRRGIIKVAAGAAAGASLVSIDAGSAAAVGRGPADLVLHGGRVVLMDRRFGVVEAIAVKNGVVVAVGDSRDMRRWIGRRTTTINLRGRTALPGINDSHLHGIRTGLALPPYNLDVGPSAVSSIAEIAQVVGAAAGALPAGSWIRGKGWNADALSEGRPPSRHDLDAVSPDNPVALVDWSNHQLWVNTRALEIAGVTADTEAPAGGVIVKDESGKPTGLFYETAMALINRHIPAFTREELAGALRSNIELALSHGITSYTEPGVGALQRSVYENLAAAGELGIRVTALLSRPDDSYPVNAEQVREVLETVGRRATGRASLFRVTGVKLRADGVPIGSRTAWMRDPYVGGGRGSLVTEGATDAEKDAELTEMVALVHAAGLQIGTHATGDAAIDAVARAYAKVLRGQRRRGQRHYVIHGDFTWPETLRTLARWGCGVNFNPNIKRLIADSQPGVVGDERAGYQTPYRAALESGVHFTSASDSPNVAPDWRQGLETVLVRKGLSGAVSGPDQRIGLRPALRSYTTEGAWQDIAEGWKGSLTLGMVADITVLDDALVDRRGRLARPAREISDLGVDLTIVGGQIAYSSENRAQRARAVRAASVSWATRPNPSGMCAHC